MAGTTTILLGIKFIFCFISAVYGLSCISCASNDVNGKCRQGGKLKKVQTCYGRNATCYSTVTGSQNGSTAITRGCSKRISCSESDIAVQYCVTCNVKHCNIQPMEININTITGNRSKSRNEYRNTTIITQKGTNYEAPQNKYIIENEEDNEEQRQEKTRMKISHNMKREADIKIQQIGNQSNQRQSNGIE